MSDEVKVLSLNEVQEQIRLAFHARDRGLVQLECCREAAKGEDGARPLEPEMHGWSEAYQAVRELFETRSFVWLIHRDRTDVAGAMVIGWCESEEDAMGVCAKLNGVPGFVHHHERIGRMKP